MLRVTPRASPQINVGAVHALKAEENLFSLNRSRRYQLMNQRALTVTTVLFFVTTLLFLLIFFVNKTSARSLWLCFVVLYLIGLHFIVLRLLFTRFLGSTRATSILVNISLVATASLIVLISAEFSLRFVFRDVTTTGDNLSYFSAQWIKTVHYNRWGFRERDFEPIKPSNIYRIAAVGDSLTFGQGISEKDRFSNLLEDKLNQNSGRRKFQVLNFGMPGAETSDEIGILTRAVLINKPDFILLQWYINDVNSVDDKRHMPHTTTIIPGKLRRNSVLFYLAHRELSQAQVRLNMVENSQQYTLDHFGDPNSRSSLNATESMDTFVKICRDAHIPLGIVLFSDTYFDPSSKLDFLLERMVAYCKEKGIPYVDTRKVLLPMQGNPALRASRFDPHPSAVANHLVANEILKKFGDMWSRQPM